MACSSSVALYPPVISTTNGNAPDGQRAETGPAEMWVSSPEPAVGVFNASPNLARAPSASLRDRLRRPLPEPGCRQDRQQSGSGEESGQARCGHGAGQRADGDEDQGVMVTDRFEGQRLGATLGATR
jgi:hypothetical protein